NPNQLPVLDSNPSATPNYITLPSSATLNVVAHDPDNFPNPLTYTWSMVSGPGTVTFSPNGTTDSATTTASFSATGTSVFTLRVTVTDGSAYVSKDVTVTVSDGVSVAPNLSFEAPALAPSQFQYLPDGGAWMFVDTAGISADNSGFTYAN